MESQIESSWSEENSLQLIAEYRAREILWNPKNENFYKKHFKQDAWNEIAQLMSMTNEKCNSKIVSLLSSYRREKLRERKSVTRGKDPADRYKSRWFAYNALKFLDDRNKPRKRRIMEILQNPSPEKTNNTEPSAMQLTPQLQTRRNITIMSTNSIGTIHTANKTGNTENSQALTKSFSTFIGAKMSTYSDQTRTSVEHAIFEILMKADRGYFELPWRQRCDQQEDHLTVFVNPSGSVANSSADNTADTVVNNADNVNSNASSLRVPVIYEDQHAHELNDESSSDNKND